MAERRAKLVLASAVLIAGLAAALLFRRPDAAPPGPVEPPFPSSLILRATEPIPLVDPPEVTSHLEGRIDAPAETPPALKSAAADELPAPDRVPPKLPARPPAMGLPTADVAATEIYTGELPPPGAAGSSRVAPSIASGRTLHRVQEGDTLSGLARRYLGSADRYPILYQANRLVLRSPDRLPVGVDLVIPQLGPTTGPVSYSPPAPSTKTDKMVPIPPGAWRRSGQQTAREPQSYRVRVGETLEDIARKFYGDTSRVPALIEANHDRLSNPDAFQEGLLLVIP
jgi:nucleoid-associated protein YgaU